MSQNDDPAKKPPPPVPPATPPKAAPAGTVGADGTDSAAPDPSATVQMDAAALPPEGGGTVRLTPEELAAATAGTAGTAGTVKWSPEEVARMAAEEAEAAEQAAAADDPLIGTLIRDKWRVLKRLGAGSFGTVYKVEDVKGGWIEALKILGVDRLSGAEADEMRARFLREAQIMKRLGNESPHIVGLSTYEEDFEAGLIYFLMEFVEGKSLADALDSEGPFSVQRTLTLAKQACHGLMAAHEGPEGVVHRDLKLENLMLTTDRSGAEIVKILDFGIAKIAEKDADSRLTTVGTLGTPGYAAPEQLRAEGVDGRTDLFAFGVILYALLTGRDPWLGGLAHEPTHQIYELMVATDRGDVRPFANSGVSVPQEVIDLVMKLLRRNPDERFQSAGELQAAIERLQAGGLAVAPGETVRMQRPDPAPTHVPDPSKPRPGDRAAAKKRRAGRAAAAVVLLASTGGAFYAQPWGRTVDESGLAALVQSGRVSELWVTEGGFEGGVSVAPGALAGSVSFLAGMRTPLFMPTEEGAIPDVVARLQTMGASVDASWEVRRLTQLAVEAQARARYFGTAGGDVQSYALRLAQLDPGSEDAAALLTKVGERMAWDAEAARSEGPPERAGELIEQCLALVPDHPRCVELSEAR